MDLLILTSTKQNQKFDHIFNALEQLDHNLIGFISLDGDRIFEAINGYTIFPFNYIYVLKYDLALINCHTNVFENLIPSIVENNIPLDKTKSIFWLLQQVMTKKYEDFADNDIQEILAYWETHELNFLNHYGENFPHTLDEMFIDKNCGLPYINFKTIEGKERRMYFPANGGGERVKGSDGKIYIRDILREQIPTSPHLYITDTHKVEDGDILIDAGVCEGNFALRYADICSKIYLFEMDKNWFEPLYRTFSYCWDKVEFVPKAVTDFTRGAVAIDEAVNIPNGSSVFLKMDIEGAEPAALRGARKILTGNKVKASICSYHNIDDAVKIKSIFQRYGYKTCTSAGYIVFEWYDSIWETMDFRKGIVYAKNF